MSGPDKQSPDMDMPSAIARVLGPTDLSEQEMTQVMQLIMSGRATDAQTGGFLTGLRAKGETVGEIAAAARVMRDLALQVNPDTPGLVDTCGTGGSGLPTFNISTAAALVAAAAGARIAKHGNRSASGLSGSADLLEAAGVNLDLTPQEIVQCIQEVGIGFMFAVNHHSAMKHAIGPRRELGVGTLFNLLGPLTNPAGAKKQLLGVFSSDWVRPLAEVLQQLGSEHALVVHGLDGLDEISITGPTQVAELKGQQIEEYTLDPEDLGVARGNMDSLLIKSPRDSLAKVEQVLTNRAGEAELGIVSLNAGAAIYLADRCSSLPEGVSLAREAIFQGAAADKLQQLIQFSRTCRSGN